VCHLERQVDFKSVLFCREFLHIVDNAISEIQPFLLMS